MNAAVKFEPGQRVYSNDGRVGEYVAPVSGGHVVTELFEEPYPDDEEDDEREFSRTGGIVTWQHVYAEPPRHLVDAVIAERLEKARNLRDEIAGLENKARALTNAQKLTKAQLAEHEALMHLGDVFAGRITHYAVENSSDEWGVYTHEQACGLDGNVSNYDDRRLTLYSRNLKDAQWTFYSTGRDYPRERKCFPFTSEASARAKVQEMIAAHLQKQLKNPNVWQIDRFIANAKNYGVAVPAELTARIIAAKTSAARDAVATAHAALAKANVELLKLIPEDDDGLNALVQAGVALDRG